MRNKNINNPEAVDEEAEPQPFILDFVETCTGAVSGTTSGTWNDWDGADQN